MSADIRRLFGRSAAVSKHATRISIANTLSQRYFLEQKGKFYVVNFEYKLLLVFLATDFKDFTQFHTSHLISPFSLHEQPVCCFMDGYHEKTPLLTQVKFLFFVLQYTGKKWQFCLFILFWTFTEFARFQVLKKERFNKMECLSSLWHFPSVACV